MRHPAVFSVDAAVGFLENQPSEGGCAFPFLPPTKSRLEGPDRRGLQHDPVRLAVRCRAVDCRHATGGVARGGRPSRDRPVRGEDPSRADPGMLFLPFGRGEVDQGGLAARFACSRSRGGESGPILVPGKPEESPIMEALRHEGLAMPPKSKLPDAVIADFERWIKLGAPDPRDGAARPAPAGRDRHRGRARDSGPISPPVAHVRRAWPTSPGRRPTIDRFVLAGLEARGLHPAPDADRSHARPAACVRPGRASALARGDRRVRGRPGAGRLRAAGRSPAGLARLRRAMGTALARRRPVRRVAHAPRIRLQGRLALSRLCHRRVQRRPAVRPLRPRSRSPATCSPPSSPHDRRRQIDRHDVPGARATPTSRSRTSASSRWTWSTSSSTRSARPSWPRRSAAPAATTTSSTRSRPGTTTRSPASSATLKALEHANVSKWLERPPAGRRRARRPRSGAGGGGRRPSRTG